MTSTSPIAHRDWRELGDDTLEATAQRALSNGWPVEEVAATLDGIVGPISPPICGRDCMADGVTASPAVQQIFDEAAKRLGRKPS